MGWWGGGRETDREEDARERKGRKTKRKFLSLILRPEQKIDIQRR
jgi:hypothetical protein